MNTILSFLNKWGVFILVIFALLIFFSTCGTKTEIEKLKKQDKIFEQTINYNDSLSREQSIVEHELSILENARETIYFENSVVRSKNRPDDLMNDYDKRIKALKEKLDKLKNASKN